MKTAEVAVLVWASLLVAGRAPSAVAATRGFLAAPTDQLGVPGALAGGEITPEGNIYTGWAEYDLSFGASLHMWRQPTRLLPSSAVPLFVSTLNDGSVRYTRAVFAISVDGVPVAFDTVTAQNRAPRKARAAVAMAIAYTRGRETRGVRGQPTGIYRYERPSEGQAPGLYDQPGQAFSTAFEYRTTGRSLERSGLLLGLAPPGAHRRIEFCCARTGSLTAFHDGMAFSMLLAPHASASHTWRIVLDPAEVGPGFGSALADVSLPDALAQLRRLWHSEEAGMMQVSVPEAKVEHTFQASVVEMLDSRYLGADGWVQASNKLQYQAVWLRDAALETQALDLVGLHAQAEQNLDFLGTFQEPDGLFISRPGQYDGLGQALWALSEHARLTRSAPFAAAQVPRIGRAISWLSIAIDDDPLGLLPPGNPGDDELAYGRITGDDLWVAVGLRSAIADARLAGDGEVAASWEAVDLRFETALRAAIGSAVARAGHIPPVLDSTEGQDWGNYNAAYPLEVLPARSPAVQATLAWARAHMVQGLATYLNGRSLHDYLGFPIFQTELEAGDVEGAVGGLYAELDHTTSTDQGWEWDIPPFGYRASDVDMSPHGTFAADYVALLRNMLVREVDSHEVSLLDGASAGWLRRGQRVEVKQAPTADGVVSFVERSHPDGETLTWNTSLEPGTTLVWQLPTWARHIRAADPHELNGRQLILSAGSGSTSVQFGGRPPTQSYKQAVAALNAAYRAHGEAAPVGAETR